MISLLWYSAAPIDCAEWTQLDRRTGTLMIMHNELHPESNVDRLYTRRKENDRELQGVEEIGNLENLGSQNYVKESRECLLNAARSVNIDLIAPIKENKIEANKQNKEQFRGGSCMDSLYDKLRKWGIKIGGNTSEMGP